MSASIWDGLEGLQEQIIRTAHFAYTKAISAGFSVVVASPKLKSISMNEHTQYQAFLTIEPDAVQRFKVLQKSYTTPNPKEALVNLLGKLATEAAEAHEELR
ncbi:hypothetical protein LTR37_017831 [Vermiconidia calcicola]|uniref:Uncharacterized protein n=1 Tax=Vermiconidia calcicola TaxID=1690605 RepID=A0ACC3MIT4_9PEZI|nr:hypothetical protein LTR37_017831 [Vermiconidia calcicola]